MRTAIFLALAATIISSSEGRIHHQRRQDAASKVVSLGVQRKTFTNPVQRDRLRRRGTAVTSLDNEETLYFVNATLGTPPQNVRLHLDTGSSDLWVNTPSSKLCLSQASPCKFAGTYTANSSSTYGYVGSYFNISYVDGSGAQGDYVTDTVTIGTTKVDKLQFGVGYSSTSAQGILGIGYEVNEVQVGRAQKAPYKNLPAQLLADGTIGSKSYSLWLNDLDSNTGSILFGGIDTEQFDGQLQTLPIQSESGVFAEFLIALTGIKLDDQVIASDIALAVLLDSGSSLTYLPDAMVQNIYTAVGAQFDANEGAAYVPCGLANQKRSLTFTFTSPSISVGMDELVLDLVTASGKRAKFKSGAPACLFGIAPAGQGTNVLGDTFLRSAYVVYDLDNNQISLAPTRFNSTATSVKEIGTGPGAVPGATLVANAATATAGLVGANAHGGLGVASGAPPSRAGAQSIAALVVVLGLLVALV